MTTIEDAIFGTDTGGGEDVDAILDMIHRAEGTRGDYSARGASGEGGKYQFMPGTWRDWSRKHLGSEQAQTPENQEKVARAQVAEWKRQGYDAAQILSLWNSGRPEGTAKGVNRQGVAYDTAAYVQRGLGGGNGGQRTQVAGAGAGSLEDQIYGSVGQAEQPARRSNPALEAIYAPKPTEPVAAEVPENSVWSGAISFAKAAGLGGLKGLITGLPEMGGAMTEFFAHKLGIELVAEVGRDLKEWAEERGKEWFGEAPESGLERIAFLGAEMLAPSIVPGGLSITGLRAVLGVGRLVRAAAAVAKSNPARATALLAEASKYASRANKLGAGMSAAMFGGQQAQNTADTALREADRLEKEGKLREAEEMRAKAEGAAPWITGGIEAVGEYIGTKYIGKLFRLSEAAVKNRGTRELVKDFAKTLGVEISTEMGQAGGQAATEKYAGIRPDANILAEVVDVIGPTAFMTIVTGGAAAGAAKLTGEKAPSKEKEKENAELKQRAEEARLTAEEEAKAGAIPKWTPEDVAAWTTEWSKELENLGITITPGTVGEDGVLPVTLTATRGLNKEEKEWLRAKFAQKVVDAEKGLWTTTDDEGRPILAKIERQRGEVAGEMKPVTEAPKEPPAEEAGPVAGPKKPEPKGPEPGAPEPPVKPAEPSAPSATRTYRDFTIEDLESVTGKAEWMAYWKAHPEEQEAMLAHLRKLKGQAVEEVSPEKAKAVMEITDEMMSPASAEAATAETVVDEIYRPLDDRIAALQAKGMTHAQIEADEEVLRAKAAIVQNILGITPGFDESSAILPGGKLQAVAKAATADEALAAKMAKPIADAVLAKDVGALTAALKKRYLDYGMDDAEIAELAQSMIDAGKKEELKKRGFYTAGQRKKERENRLAAATRAAEKAAKEAEWSKKQRKKGPGRPGVMDYAEFGGAEGYREYETMVKLHGQRVADLLKDGIRKKWEAAVAKKTEERQKTAAEKLESEREKESVARNKKWVEPIAPKKEAAATASAAPVKETAKAPVSVKKEKPKKERKVPDVLADIVGEEAAARVKGGKAAAPAAATTPAAPAAVAKKEEPAKKVEAKAPAPAAPTAAPAAAPELKELPFDSVAEILRPVFRTAIIDPKTGKPAVSAKGDLRRKKDMRVVSLTVTPGQDIGAIVNPTEAAALPEITDAMIAERARLLRADSPKMSEKSSIAQAKRELGNERAAKAKAAGRKEVSVPGHTRHVVVRHADGALVQDRTGDLRFVAGDTAYVMDSFEGRKQKPVVHIITVKPEERKEEPAPVTEPARGDKAVADFQEKFPVIESGNRDVATKYVSKRIGMRVVPMNNTTSEEDVRVLSSLLGMADLSGIDDVIYGHGTDEEIGAFVDRNVTEGKRARVIVIEDNGHMRGMDMQSEGRANLDATAGKFVGLTPTGRKKVKVVEPGAAPRTESEKRDAAYDVQRKAAMEKLGEKWNDWKDLTKRRDSALENLKQLNAQLARKDLDRWERKDLEGNEFAFQVLQDVLNDRIDALQSKSKVSDASRGKVIRATVPEQPMRYTMPADGIRPGLRHKYPNGSTTAALMNNGDRTATTRNKFANVGDIVHFGSGVEGLWLVVEIKKPDLESSEGRADWEELEGWDLRYIDRKDNLRRQVYSPNAVQTVLKKIRGKYESDLAAEGQAKGAGKAAEGKPGKGTTGAQLRKPGVGEAAAGVPDTGAPSLLDPEEPGYIARFRASAYAKTVSGERGGAHFVGRETFPEESRVLLDSMIRELPEEAREYLLNLYENSIGSRGIPIISFNEETMMDWSEEERESLRHVFAMAANSEGHRFIIFNESLLRLATSNDLLHEIIHIANGDAKFDTRMIEPWMDKIIDDARKFVSYVQDNAATMDQRLRPTAEALVTRLLNILNGQGFEKRKEVVMRTWRNPTTTEAELNSPEGRQGIEYLYSLTNPDNIDYDALMEIAQKAGVPVDVARPEDTYQAIISMMHVLAGSRTAIGRIDGVISLPVETIAYVGAIDKDQARAFIKQVAEGTARREPARIVAEKKQVAAIVPAISPNSPMRIKSLGMPEIVHLAKELLGGIENILLRKNLRAAQGAKGRFNSENGIVTLDAGLFADIKEASGTLGHEVGHVVDWLPDKLAGIPRGNLLGRIATLKKFMKERFGTLARNSEIRTELKNLTQLIKPFDEDAVKDSYTDYRYSSAELYADAISTLVNDPELLRTTCPKFYSGFFDYLHTKPTVKRVYDEIQSKIQDEETTTRWRLELLGGALKKAEDLFDEQIEKSQLNRRTWREKGIETLREMYYGAIDKNQMSITAHKKLRKAGVTWDAEKDPIYLMEELPYVDNLAMLLKKDFQDLIIESQEAGIDYKDLRQYVLLSRVMEYQVKGIPYPGGYTLKDATGMYEQMRDRMGEKTFNRMGQIQDKMFEIWNARVLDKIEKAELLSDEQMAEMRKNRTYFTFFDSKYFDQLFRDDGSFRGMKGQIYSTGHGDLNLEQLDPFVATALKGSAIIRSAHVKMAMKSNVALWKEFYGEECVRDATYVAGGNIKPPPSGFDTLIMMHKGKVKAYYVRTRMAAMFKEDPYEMGMIANVIRVATGIFKKIFVQYNPPWILRNLVRDTLDTYKKLPGVSLPKLIKTMITDGRSDAWRYVFQDVYSNDVKEMMEGMMLVSGRAYKPDEGPGTVKEIEKNLLFYGKNYKQYQAGARGFVQHWLDRIDNFGQFTEAASKISAYKVSKQYRDKLKKEERDLLAVPSRSAGQQERLDKVRDLLDRLSAEKILSHDIRSKAGTPDVYRRGRLSWLYNNIWMFSNIGKEGWRAHWEAMHDHEWDYLWKTVKVTIMPKLLILAASWGMMGDWWKKYFDNISEYNKSTHSILPLWMTDKGESVYLRLAPDYGGQLIGSMFYRTAQLATALISQGKYKYNPDEWTNTMDFILDTTPYGSMHPIWGLMSEVVDLAKGVNPYDSFTGKPIIPEQIYKAKDYRAALAFAGHVWNKMGGRVVGLKDVMAPVFRTETVPHQQKEFYERFADNVPFLGPTAWTYVQMSDYGKRQRYDWIARDIEVEDFRRQLDRSERVKDVIKEQIDAGRAPSPAAANRLYRELVKEGNIDPRVTSWHNFLHTYNRYATRTYDNRELDQIVFARNNRTKAELLWTYKNTMPPADYNRILHQLFREGHVSGETMAAMRRLESERARR